MGKREERLHAAKERIHARQRRRKAAAEEAESVRQGYRGTGTRLLTEGKGPKGTTITSTYQDPSIYQLGKMAPQLTTPKYSRYFTETSTPSGSEVAALYDRRKIAAAKKNRRGGGNETIQPKELTQGEKDTLWNTA
jgi:hypothetical protein